MTSVIQLARTEAVIHLRLAREYLNIAATEAQNGIKVKDSLEQAEENIRKAKLALDEGRLR